MASQAKPLTIKGDTIACDASVERAPVLGRIFLHALRTARFVAGVPAQLKG
jgi:hypothetical protein